MSEKQIINALGMKCPRPIVELAKARRRAPAGSEIEIIADDLAFESDVRAWCETTGSCLQALRTESGKITATIRICEAGEAAA